MGLFSLMCPGHEGKCVFGSDDYTLQNRYKARAIDYGLICLVLPSRVPGLSKRGSSGAGIVME
jgi:hypothetical protein